MNYNLLSKMLNSNGKIFTVKFFKRTDGKLRVMNCRLGVQKDLKGDGPKYNAQSKNLLSVYDMQKQQYRNVNLDCVLSVTINGEEFHNEEILDEVKQLVYKLDK